MVFAALSTVSALAKKYKTDFAATATSLLPAIIKLTDSRIYAPHPHSTLRPAQPYSLAPRQPALVKHV